MTLLKNCENGYMNDYSKGLVICKKIFYFTLLIYMCAISAHQTGMGFDALFVRLSFSVYVGCFFLYQLVNRVNSRLIISKHFKWIVLFVLYYYFSILWATSITDSLHYNNIFIQIVVNSFIFTNIVKDKETINKVLGLIVCSLIYTLILLYIKTPSSSWGVDRVGEAIGLHSNGLGMRLAIGTIICLYFLNKSKKKYLYLLLAISFSGVALFTGSKKVIIMLVLGFFLFEILISKRKNIVFNIVLIAGACYGLYVLIMTNPDLYHVLGRRIETFLLTISGEDQVNQSTIYRLYFINAAQQIFLNNPIFGCGANNFVTQMRMINFDLVAYSHNNYWELLSTLGIVGFSIYYFLFIEMLRILIRYYFQSSEKMLISLMLTIILVILVTDYANVSYINEFTHIVIVIAFCVYRLIGKGNIINGANEKNIKSDYIAQISNFISSK